MTTAGRLLAIENSGTEVIVRSDGAVFVRQDVAEAVIDRLRGALSELVEVAELRGDSDLPAPPDDPRLWTARMQEAWDEARRIVEGPELEAAIAASKALE